MSVTYWLALCSLLPACRINLCSALLGPRQADMHWKANKFSAWWDSHCIPASWCLILDFSALSFGIVSGIACKPDTEVRLHVVPLGQPVASGLAALWPCGLVALCTCGLVYLWLHHHHKHDMQLRCALFQPVNLTCLPLWHALLVGYQPCICMQCPNCMPLMYLTWYLQCLPAIVMITECSHASFVLVTHKDCRFACFLWDLACSHACVLYLGLDWGFAFAWANTPADSARESSNLMWFAFVPWGYCLHCYTFTNGMHNCNMQLARWRAWIIASTCGVCFKPWPFWALHASKEPIHLNFRLKLTALFVLQAHASLQLDHVQHNIG